mgnify:CR=1 FL=1
MRCLAPMFVMTVLGGERASGTATRSLCAKLPCALGRVASLPLSRCLDQKVEAPEGGELRCSLQLALSGNPVTNAAEVLLNFTQSPGCAAQ